MKKISVLSVIVAISLYAGIDTNSTNNKSDFNQAVFKQLDQKITEIHQAIDAAKQTRMVQPTEKVDKTALPVVEGTYSIYVNNKLKKREAYVKDSGGGQMYINGSNNMVVKSIQDDAVTFKAGSDVIRSPVNFTRTKSTTASMIKPTINNYSSQTAVTPANNLPAIDQVVKRLEDAGIKRGVSQ